MTGLNFAAGMSGGITFVWDPDGTLEERCNMSGIGLEKVEDRDDLELLHCMIKLHGDLTGSEVAGRILSDWPDVLGSFTKVMPLEFKEVLKRDPWRRPTVRDLGIDEGRCAATG